MMVDNPYDEPLTAEDEQVASTDATVPIPEDDSGPAIPVEPAGADADPASPATPATPATAGETPTGPGEADDPRFKAFLEQHTGKTAEELLQLAYQQQARANREGYDARKARETVQQVAERAQQVLEARKAAIEQKRQDFAKRLEEDPDAATKALHDERLNEEIRRAEQEAIEAERSARVETAVQMTMTAMPHFPEIANEVFKFGREMNYSDDEIRGIEDARDMITLTLGSFSARLIQAGLMDLRGNLNVDKLLAGASGGTPAQPVDPRLKAPPPPTSLGQQPARSANVQMSADQRIAALLSDDAALAKLSDDDLRELTKHIGLPGYA